MKARYGSNPIIERDNFIRGEIRVLYMAVRLVSALYPGRSARLDRWKERLRSLMYDKNS
jgi:hypothetical protein